MHTVARASSPSSMQHSYYPYHAAPAAYPASRSPGETLATSYPFPPPPSGLNNSAQPMYPSSQSMYPSSHAESTPNTPARGCLKPPTKEFSTGLTPDLPSHSSLPPPGASSSRRRPNMKLERLPSAIARIQLAEGVEHNPTSSSAAKCKTRVLTPYVKSDKDTWLSDAEE